MARGVIDCFSATTYNEIHLPRRAPCSALIPSGTHVKTLIKAKTN